MSLKASHAAAIITTIALLVPVAAADADTVTASIGGSDTVFGSNVSVFVPVVTPCRAAFPLLGPVLAATGNLVSCTP